MFQVGEQVIWTYQTGWAGGETRQADAEVVKVNRVKVKIRVWRKVGDVLKEEIKDVLPTSIYPKAERFYLHRVDKYGWRDTARMITPDYLDNTLWALRHSEHEQWFIRRYSDGVIIAQSKDCKWTEIK